MKKIFISLLCIVLLAAISGCSTIQRQGESAFDNETIAKQYEGKKILFINSYHEGYEWSDGIEKGVHKVLDDTGVELIFFRMDTKRNTEESFMKQKSLEAISIIEEFNPDVVIVSDDNAFKYLVMPYYKNADIPFVFCGLNWDASIYGAPYNNTAGMVEVALISQLISHLKNYAKGDRIGYIAGDVLSAKKEAENYMKLLNISLKEKYVNDFSEWKEAFIDIQEEVDILIVYNNAGIDNWDDDEAKDFLEKNTEIPTGTTLEHIIPYSLIALARVSEEQGEWSAETALRILDGEFPSEIPIVKNKRGSLMLNLNIADKLEIVFSPLMIKNAKSIIKE